MACSSRFGYQTTAPRSRGSNARSQNCYFFLKSVDLTKLLITVGIGASGLLAVNDNLAVAEDAKILIGVGKTLDPRRDGSPI